MSYNHNPTMTHKMSQNFAGKIFRLTRSSLAIQTEEKKKKWQQLRCIAKD